MADRPLPRNLLEWASDDAYTTNPPGSGATKVAPSAAVAAEGFRPSVGHITAQEANYQLNRVSQGVRWAVPKMLVPQSQAFDELTGTTLLAEPDTELSVAGTYYGVIFCPGDGAKAPSVWDKGKGISALGTVNDAAVCEVSDDWVIVLEITGGNIEWRAHTTRSTKVTFFGSSGSDSGVLFAAAALPADQVRSAAMNDDVGVFISLNDDGVATSDTLYQLTWDENWAPTWTATARTAPVGTAVGHAWQLYGKMAYHDGTLVVLFCDDGPVYGIVTVSTDDGVTWSTPVAVHTVSAGSWIMLDYSDVLGGWVAMTSLGHIYLCTGDPSVAVNWVRQSTGTESASAVDGIAVFTSAACVDGTIIACGLWEDAAAKPGFVLITDDYWTTFSAEPGWNEVRKAGAWLLYYHYLVGVGLVQIRQFDALPWGDPT